MIGEKKSTVNSDSSESSDSKRKQDQRILPKSKSLLIHAHGGGFVAQSSKSHQVYLLEWATYLNVPILSIDYSLAPEQPYPQALNEMFYLYCWALNNSEKLGSTCERIVFCGDSAGANLSLTTTLKCIDMKIRKPDGVFLAYCPILVAMDPSPSRLLCLMDPLIPFGFMMRCLKAYSSGQYSDDDETRAGTSNLQDLEEMKRAKAEHNEELKRKFSLKPDIIEQEISDEDKSDSFEEISCFERHQTDSDIKAHISQTSDVASNDTLAGASFLTKDSNVDTIEIVSPIDSIRSATSLEEDSLPITIHKNDKIMSDIDLQPTTSDEITRNHNKKYVDDFIEKYVLDAKQNDDGLVKPILRKVSRTRSEENIIFDISKDTLSVQSFQQKAYRVASTLVDTVSSTFDQITKSNRPILRNYSCDDADGLRMLDNELVPQSPSSDFIFTVPKDPLLSPFHASDEMLSQLPPIKILSLTLDTCLDDSIMFAKRLKKLNVDFTFDLLDGLPHGFLNFSRVSFCSIFNISKK
jgi:hormone-sensitive lipase